MRKPLVMGNWKLNGTKESVTALVNALKAPADKAAAKADVAVCAPAIFIGMVEELASGSKLQWGSEDCDVHTQGAFTGENSPTMLREFGCTYAIVGHSERRAMGETDADVNAKVLAALEAGLIPIMCCGESLEQRNSGVTAEWITMQIKLGLAGVPEDKIRKVIIAYEPIWAIGTGLTATPEQAEEVCEMIRSVVRKLYSSKNARAISILYGGSMNEKNAFELLAQPDIDGGLIGGASLVPEKFVKIIEAANQPTV